MFTKLIAIGSLLAPQAFATVFITSPTASTTCHGGQVCSLAWKEDDKNTPPLLADWGLASVGLWVGNQQQQTELQRIQDGVNVQTVANITFTPDPSIGPNSNVYFIRFTSATAKDPTNAQFPAESFSAKFALDNMSGQFNSTVQAQISGATTAPVPGPTPTTTAGSNTATAKSSSTTGTGTAKTSGSPTAKPSSAASPLNVSGAGLVGASVAALFAFFL